MRKGWLFAVLAGVVAMGSQAFADASVTNVRASQRAGTKLVDIYYNLSGGAPPISVSIQASSDAGVTYALPVGSVTGNVGANVTAGTNRKITWSAGADWNGQFSAAVKFKITASGTPPAVIAHLMGQVTHNGGPVAGVPVLASQGSLWVSATTDANGNFDLGVLSNGTWNVTLQQNYAYSNNLVGPNLQVNVTNGQYISGIAFQIADATGTISGTVMDANFNPLAQTGVWASATINGWNFIANAQTDVNGNYSFPVIDGTWTVGVNSPLNFSQQTVAVTGSAQVNFNK